MAPPTTNRHQEYNERTEVKHVSRACLECRSRHLKCDGKGPICSRCLKFNRECQYVKSNRGGSRKKGVSTKKQKLQDGSAAAASIKNKHSDAVDGFILPCVKNGLPDMADRDVCKSQCLESDTYNKLPPCLTGVKIPEKKKQGINFHPTFNSSKEKLSIDIVFDQKYLKSDPADYYISPALVRDLDIESIVNTYYSYFHKIHPFMPQRDDVIRYLNSIPYKYDLLLAMKLIGDGQSSSTYSKDVETVNFLITNILDYTKQIGKDFVSLQAVLLVSMVSHISSLHDLSSLLRETLVSLALELGINMIDQDNIPPVFMDVNGYVTETSDDKTKTGVSLMHTPSEDDSKNILSELMSARRTIGIPKDIIEDMVRRTLWEIYFFDTLSGTASGQTTSVLATQKMLCFYPKTIALETFDYKSRAESCKLVNDAIKLNVAIQANKEIQTHLVHMSAAIGNWEMRIENPDLFKAPYLVNVNGQVNEGVHQSIMLVNYAKIFTHRPFSYLWRPDISRHPRCTDEEGVTDNCQSLKKQDVDSRKIIETRKTIDSASSVVKALLDTNPAKVLHRTPFLACALAFSCLVHLSAYSWVESSLQVLDENSETLNSLKNSISEDELDIYTEYIKLELGGIFQISRHWALSNKLTSHIRDTLIKVSPKLFKRVQLSLPDSQQQQQQHQHPPHQSIQIGSTTPSTIRLQSRPPPRKDIPKLSASAIAMTDSGTNTTELFTNSDTASSFNDRPTTGFNTPLGAGTAPPIMEQSQTIALPNSVITDTNNEMNEIDFNLMFDGDLDALSPSSETGCDWVDKHIFEFDAYNINATN